MDKAAIRLEFERGRRERIQLDKEARELAQWIETEDLYLRCSAHEAGRRCILPRGHDHHRFADEL